MSSNIFTNSVRVVAGENNTLDVVVRNQPDIREQEFADFVRSAIERKGLKLREIERESNGEISHSYLSKIMSGAVSPLGLSVGKLFALANVIDAPYEQLMAVLSGRAWTEANATERVILAKVRRLPQHWREGFIGILDMLHREHIQPREEHKGARPAAKRRIA